MSHQKHLGMVMKLSEIKHVGTQLSHGIKLDDLKGEHLLKDDYLGAYQIWISKLPNDQVSFSVKDGNTTIAMLVGVTIDDLKLKSGKVPLMIKRTWCEVSFRNKGIITNLYRFLYSDQRFALISDVEQSPESVTIWKKLSVLFGAEMIEIKTGDICPIDDRLYGDDKFAMIIESNTSFIRSSILNDYVFEGD